MWTDILGIRGALLYWASNFTYVLLASKKINTLFKKFFFGQIIIIITIIRKSISEHCA